jgi:hypothetical protein
MRPVPTLNDGSARPPRLRVDLCLGTLASPPEWSTFPRATGDALWPMLKDAGFEGVQGGDGSCRAHGLGFSSSGRFDRPDEVDAKVRAWKDKGSECATVHVGGGFEDDDAMDRLSEALLRASERWELPVYLETHRATMTQDMQRTLKLVERFPELRFNGDLSHWYTGLEMSYCTSIEKKFDRIQPVLERIRFMHGRIGDGGCMQVAVDPERDADRPHIQHFRSLWKRTFVAFIRGGRPGDYLVFAPELLHAANCYARRVPGPDGMLREESDRWQQAQILARLARQWFAEAESEASAANQAKG